MATEYTPRNAASPQMAPYVAMRCDHPTATSSRLTASNRKEPTSSQSLSCASSAGMPGRRSARKIHPHECQDRESSAPLRPGPRADPRVGHSTPEPLPVKRESRVGSASRQDPPPDCEGLKSASRKATSIHRLRRRARDLPCNQPRTAAISARSRPSGWYSTNDSAVRLGGKSETRVHPVMYSGKLAVQALSPPGIVMNIVPTTTIDPRAYAPTVIHSRLRGAWSTVPWIRAADPSLSRSGRRSAHVIANPSNPGHRAGPEISASPADAPAHGSLRLIQNPQAAIVKVRARMELPASRESAVSPGSNARAKDRITAVRGLSCSRKSMGTRISALPARAGISRASALLAPPKAKNSAEVSAT